MSKSRFSKPLLFLAFGNMILIGVFNSMRGVSFPLIRNDFDASYSNMGLLTALVSYTMMAFCIIAGTFMDKFGLKRNLLMGFAFIIGGTLFFHGISSFWMAAMHFLIIQGGLGFFEVGLNGLGSRIFTVKTALMMNLLHFCYGLGAMAGPRFMGIMFNQGRTWQGIYPLLLIPVLLMLGLTLFVRFPAHESSSKEGPTFWRLMKEPMVWVFGGILGLAGVVEGSSVSWSGLYLHDVYGLDAGTAMTGLVSLFYLLFTLTRLVSGFFIEKIGYVKSVITAAVGILATYILVFIFGEGGIRLIPLAGIFVALMWPTVMAINVVYFKERAQTVSSAIICIAAILGGAIHYIIGLTNRFIGPAWGFRSVLLYASLLLVLLIILGRKMMSEKAQA